MAKDEYVLLGIGQSNMVGWVKGVNGGNQSTDEGVQAWNSQTGQFEVARLDPSFAMTDGLNAGNNMVWAYGRHLHEETGIDVKIIIDGHSGNPIGNWLGKSDPNYELMDEKIKDAGVDHIDSIIFAQGEANNDHASIPVNSQAEYKNSLKQLVNKLYSENYVTNDTVFMMPHLMDNGKAHNQSDRNDVIDLLDNDGDARTVLASIYEPFARELGTLDNLHWDQNALVTIGETALWHGHLKGLLDSGNREIRPE